MRFYDNHFKKNKEEGMEEAVKYLIIAILENNDTERPILMHSLRVGYRLEEYNYETNLIIAGILHDIVIETHVTNKDIANNFDPEIAKLIKAYSLYDDFTEILEQYDLNYPVDYKFVKNLLVLKCIDYADILKHYSVAIHTEEYIHKLRKFKNRFHEILKNEPGYNQFLEQYEKLNENRKYHADNF
ncbi:MAG: HD domain-containing protein [Candidatus Mcinerneyibacterium aminivorans]|uniref:HD domain-containing protein n=1 Tax=Candidatus Mcinerneyibacterium aminivorans TaxID=2703815 RepID=A0A5D0MJJ6_9BACT|nr:MAG: HD domain-containing protein [Candidatus Mcinerneyibacterium aminivorans]